MRITALVTVLAAVPFLACAGESDPGGDGSPETTPAAATPAAPTVYFIDAAGETSRMLRWSENAGLEVVRPELGAAARGLALDAAGARLFWASRGDDVLQHGPLEGTEIEDLPVAGLDSVYAVAIHDDLLYWSDYGRDEILRSGLDGEDVTVLVDGLVAPRAFALDAEGGWLYWVDRGAGRVQRAPLGGGEPEDLVTESLPAPYGIAIDPTDGTLLVADAELGTIFRVDPAAPSLGEYLPDAGTHPSFLAVDEPAGMLYWTDNRDNVLRRMPLGGGPVETLVEGLAGPRGLVLVR